MPLALNDDQLELVKRVAWPIPPEKRELYLRRVARLLAGRKFSTGDVQQAAAKAQREALGITQLEARRLRGQCPFSTQIDLYWPDQRSGPHQA
jgi:hypothetical protein